MQPFTLQRACQRDQTSHLRRCPKKNKETFKIVSFHHQVFPPTHTLEQPQHLTTAEMLDCVPYYC